VALNGAAINGFAINGAAASGPAGTFGQDNFDLRWELFSLIQRDSRFDVLWDIRGVVDSPLSVRLILNVDAEVNYPLIESLDAALSIPLSWALDSALNVSLPLSELIDAETIYLLRMPDKEPVDAEINYPLFMSVDALTNYPLNLRTDVDMGITYPLRLGVTVTSPITIGLGLPVLDPITSPFRYIWSLVDETSNLVTDIITLTIVATSEQIEMEGAVIEILEGSFAYTANVTLADVRDLPKFSFDTEVQLDLNGELYNMVVDQKERARTGPEIISGVIKLVSISARNATPRAVPLTVQFSTPIGAKAAVESILGESVTWDIIDWSIPANRLGAEGASPIQVAQQVAEAAGGLIESNPDGTLYVRYLYPVSVPDYPTAPIVDTYLESDAILSFTEGYVGGDTFNKLRIRDTGDATFSDIIEFEPNEDELSGILFVYPGPFRLVTVEHTSDGLISLISLGESTLTKIQENVEIREGEATLRYPIESIDSVVWKDTNIGPLTFEVGSETVFSSDPVNLFSLIDITYSTKALTWSTSSPVDDFAQFLVRDC